MHGFRIAIYGGVTANPSPIAVRATREGSERSTCPGLGDILGDQEVAISCSGGDDLPAHQRKHPGAGNPCPGPRLPALPKRKRPREASHPPLLMHPPPGRGSPAGG